MKPITQLWNAGILGKLAVSVVALLLSCCALGAFGSLIRPRATHPIGDLPPAFAASAKTTIPPAAAAPTPAISQPTQPADLPSAAVVRVVDGDTVIIRLSGNDVRVRLIGIDTPEIVDPRKPVQCFAREASDKARQLLDGQTVALEADSSQDDKDRYGRLLRYIWLPDGQLFNYEMVAQGYAFEYTYRVPYKYQAAFKDAQRAAREQQRGLWSPATCAGEQRPADAAPAPSPKPRPSPMPRPTAAPAPQQLSPAASCDPAYPDVCIPPAPPDLDCGDIPYRRFRVLRPDPHRFDGDRDGIGCER